MFIYNIARSYETAVSRQDNRFCDIQSTSHNSKSHKSTFCLSRHCSKGTKVSLYNHIWFYSHKSTLGLSWQQNRWIFRTFHRISRLFWNFTFLNRIIDILWIHNNWLLLDTNCGVSYLHFEWYSSYHPDKA